MCPCVAFFSMLTLTTICFIYVYVRGSVTATSIIHGCAGIAIIILGSDSGGQVEITNLSVWPHQLTYKQSDVFFSQSDFFVTLGNRF